MGEKLSVNWLREILEEAGIRLVSIVTENGKLEVFVSPKPSGAAAKKLKQVRDIIAGSADFAGHEAVFIGHDDAFKTLFFAFIHSTKRGLSQGGLRFKPYDSLEAVVSDGLRLSQGMSRKNAVCGLLWGGGKGIIPKTDDIVRETLGGNPGNSKEESETAQEQRDPLFEAYGKFVAKINGAYYTAADIGTYERDMLAILKKNRFVTCLPRSIGGSGDPSPHTAEGIFLAVRTVRKYLTGSEGLSGMSVAVQGAGKVGWYLIEKLTEAGAKVFVSDYQFEINKEKRQEFLDRFPKARIVPCGPGMENDIFGLEVEVIAPCAVGGVINAQTIGAINPSVKIICGGANNILGDENKDGDTLYFDKGIVYIPDFVCNWMGIMNCADEAFGYLEEDIENALYKVPGKVNEILKAVESDTSISHTAAAHQIADREIAMPLPREEFRKGRGQRLIQNLLKDQERILFDSETDAA